MKSKILSKHGLIVILCIALVLFLATQFFPDWKNFIQNGLQIRAKNNVIPQLQEEKVSFGLPSRIMIPRINIDTTIEQSGLTPQGAMDIPKGPNDVAWFNFGPRPGEKGSSVIAGHYGWKNGIAAVFDNLHELQKGDKIYVEDENGEVTTFVVNESRKYDAKGDASDVFGSIDGKAHLNLITCVGKWNRVSESRPDRLVVFTDKE